MTHNLAKVVLDMVKRAQGKTHDLQASRSVYQRGPSFARTIWIEFRSLTWPHEGSVGQIIGLFPTSRQGTTALDYYKHLEAKFGTKNEHDESSDSQLTK